MGKSARNLKESFKYPDQQAKEFVEASMELLNYYKKAKGLDIISPSAFVTNAVLAAASEVHKFHREYLEQAKKVQAEAKGGAENVVEDTKTIKE